MMKPRFSFLLPILCILLNTAAYANEAVDAEAAPTARESINEPAVDAAAQDPASEPASTGALSAAGTTQITPGSFQFTPLIVLYFDHDQSIISERDQQRLQALVSRLIGDQTLRRLLIRGHADDSGSVAHNDRLSDKRAEKVRDYLLQAGIDAGLPHILGQGEHRPVDENWTREGRQRNRRVELYGIHAGLSRY